MIKKYLFLDFNGTLIDDVQLCLDLLNEMLSKQGARTLSKEEYRHVFKFPIRRYYEDAGIDFKKNSFEELAVEFISKYQPASLVCGLYPHMVETLTSLQTKGYVLVLLSASDLSNLLEQVKYYQIDHFFTDILGLDNIYAKSKVDIAKNYMARHNIDPKDVLMIGDTLHDLEVARTIGVDCKLVSCGHQAYDVLASGNVEIISSLKDLL